MDANENIRLSSRAVCTSFAEHNESGDEGERQSCSLSKNPAKHLEDEISIKKDTAAPPKK